MPAFGLIPSACSFFWTLKPAPDPGKFLDMPPSPLLNEMAKFAVPLFLVASCCEVMFQSYLQYTCTKDTQAQAEVSSNTPTSKEAQKRYDGNLLCRSMAYISRYVSATIWIISILCSLPTYSLIRVYPSFDKINQRELRQCAVDYDFASLVTSVGSEVLIPEPSDKSIDPETEISSTFSNQTLADWSESSELLTLLKLKRLRLLLNFSIGFALPIVVITAYFSMQEYHELAHKHDGDRNTQFQNELVLSTTTFRNRAKSTTSLTSRKSSTFSLDDYNDESIDFDPFNAHQFTDCCGDELYQNTKMMLSNLLKVIILTFLALWLPYITLEFVVMKRSLEDIRQRKIDLSACPYFDCLGLGVTAYAIAS